MDIEYSYDPKNHRIDMDSTVTFDHPKDNYYWELFLSSEELYQLIVDLESVLECVKNNDMQMLETDHANLKNRAAYLTDKISKAKLIKVLSDGK